MSIHGNYHGSATVSRKVSRPISLQKLNVRSIVMCSCGSPRYTFRACPRNTPRSNGAEINSIIHDVLLALDLLTMWRLASNRPWQSSSLSFLLGRTLDRTSATKIVDCTWISEYFIRKAFPCMHMGAYFYGHGKTRRMRMQCTMQTFLSARGTRLSMIRISRGRKSTHKLCYAIASTQPQVFSGLETHPDGSIWQCCMNTTCTSGHY